MIEIAKETLKKVFGYDEFRPLQEKVVTHVMEGNDSLVLMPTGGGKSICFQIPAIAKEGTALVISPLIALMKDQVEGLKQNGVAAEFLNSSQSDLENKAIINRLTKGEIKLLYVAPEKLFNPDFDMILHQVNVNLIAIDEAHCVSTWGHDFRPEYSKLKFLKQRYKGVPMIALTATADKDTRKDILDQLGMDEPKTFIDSFDRKNIALTVVPGKDRLKKILDFLDDRENQAGIIYCTSRKSTESLAAKLVDNGINAGFYHAGRPSADRNLVQQQFLEDKVEVICATVAFGMGIDKSNVRWVIHYNLPKNIESYYQEIGRAGRDGVDSEALLFYSYADIITIRKLIENSSNAVTQVAKLDRMEQFATALICRRKILLNYFGEISVTDCGNCDVCKSPPEYFDGTLLVQKALSAVVRSGQKIAPGLLVDVLRGSVSAAVLERNLHKIKTHGAGRDVRAQDWHQYIHQMLHFAFLELSYAEGGILKLTSLSEKVLYEKETANLVKLSEDRWSASKAVRQPKAKSSKDELFDRLRKLRLAIANKGGVPAYLVFNDATLTELADEKPMTLNEMALVSGVGERKLDAYGQEFLNEILDFITGTAKSGKRIKGGTFLETLELFNQGLSVKEISTQRGISETTVYSHYAQLFEQDKIMSLAQFVSAEEVAKVKKVAFGKDQKSLKPIYAELNGEVDYHKIRLALAVMNRN